jgi:hypothetical protein
MVLIITILSIKILFTLTFTIYPLLFKSRERINGLMNIDVSKAYLYRLYGVSILAILIAYSTGIVSALNGNYPWGIVFMGLVSNGVPAFIIIKHSEFKKLKSSALFFGGIFSALLLSALFQFSSGV